MDCLCVFFSPYAPRDPVSPCVIIHLIHLSHLFHCGPPDLPRHPGSSALHLRSGSSTTCSAAVGWPPGVVSLSASKAPPSVGSTVGCNHGCCLGPAWLLLLQVPPVVSLTPPVSSLAPPSVVSTLYSVHRPPPRYPSSSQVSSEDPTQPSLCWFYGARTRLMGGGKYVRIMDCLCVFFSPRAPRDPVSHFFFFFLWLVIWFACVFLKCCIFLQFYLHYTTDYTCMIVYVTNNKEPWTLNLEPCSKIIPCYPLDLSFSLCSLSLSGIESICCATCVFLSALCYPLDVE